MPGLSVSFEPLCFTKSLIRTFLVWKRGKDHKYLGSVHAGELPEFYSNAANITDNVGTDLVGEYFAYFLIQESVLTSTFSKLHQHWEPQHAKAVHRHDGQSHVQHHLAIMEQRTGCTTNVPIQR